MTDNRRTDVFVYLPFTGRSGDNAPERLSLVHTRDRGPHDGVRWAGLDAVRGVVDSPSATGAALAADGSRRNHGSGSNKYNYRHAPGEARAAWPIDRPDGAGRSVDYRNDASVEKNETD